MKRGRIEQAAMLSTFVFRQESTRVGTESAGAGRYVGGAATEELFACVCVCMGHHAHFSHFSVVGEANCKNKARSYSGFDMSRITCSIECAAYYLLITLSALYTLSCPCSMASSHCPAHSTHTQPLGLFLYLLTLTKLKRFSLGWAQATWKLQWSLHVGPLPGTSPAASCSIVLAAAVLVNSRHWRLLPSPFYGPPLGGLPGLPRADCPGPSLV